MTARWRAVWIEKPYLKGTERLNDVPEDCVDTKHLPVFQRNKRIYRALALDKPLVEVAKRYRISCPRIHYIMTRALCRKDVDDTLSKGLLPYCRAKQGVRVKPINSEPGRRGKAYAFYAFLDTHPLIQQELDKAIWLDKTDKPQGRNLTPKTFHKFFVRLVRNSNIQEDDYPLCDATIAKESCRLYLRRKQREFQAPKPRK